MKKGILRNFAKFTGKHLCQILVPWQKGTLVFSYEVCKISKNTFFTGHIWATVSAHVMNLLLFLILESLNMIIVLICCKNMTVFSKSVNNSLFVQIVSYCIGKNISINTLCSNVRLFVAIHKVEEWSKIGSCCNCCVFS